MAFEHMYDLVVSTGEYNDRQGNTKKKWLTIGKMFEGDKGPFLVLEPHINIGALPRGPKGSVVVNCYEPKQRDDSGKTGQAKKPQHSGAFNAGEFDDDIPF